jgi:hypothetical protein
VYVLCIAAYAPLALSIDYNSVGILDPEVNLKMKLLTLHAAKWSAGQALTLGCDGPNCSEWKVLIIGNSNCYIAINNDPKICSLCWRDKRR